MTTENNLESDFEEVIRQSLQETLKIYRPTYFIQEVATIGALAAVKKLIRPLNRNQLSDGFMKLYEHKRLDLTVEAVVWDNCEKFSSLFSEDELETCKIRLTEYHYFK
ncbi:hypothetical protein ACWN8P_01125 [Vagococcus salmoninarum]|uniref:Uncharacterized protein n=1 Tax=Vagococcus salmoninarum TaxID=2739 RepID=A0A429ZVH8_9ENTE|nr:hypothetical protein [Vagococcus salmoninarum]RST97789.1 hypothetical protein CBF35_00410 [Vagococcus salmoninarum]